MTGTSESNPLPISGSAVGQTTLLRALFRGSWETSARLEQGCPLLLPQVHEGPIGHFSPPAGQYPYPHGLVRCPSLVSPANLTAFT